MRITLDTRDVKRYEKQLHLFARRAYPFATKSTLNTAAFDAQRRYRTLARTTLTLRNTYTRTSIQVEQARGLNVDKQRATVGSTAPYMRTQEFGGVEVGGGLAQPIATNESAGIGRGVRPRHKLPTRRNLRKNIILAKKHRKGSNRKQKNIAAIYGAAKTGGVVFLNMGRTKGLFRVKGRGRHVDVKMIWSLSKKQVRIPANPMLKPAVLATQKMIPRFYLTALKFQIDKHGLFK